MAVKDWLGITEQTLKIVDQLNDDQLSSLKKSLDRTFDQVSKEMLKLYGQLEGANPEYIQVRLSKLNQLKIARQLLSPHQAQQFEKEFKELLENQTTEGIKYADIMTQALTNPPELVQQFGTVNINASAIAQDATKRLKKHTQEASKKIIDAVSDNLLTGGSIQQLTKTLQGILGTTKARAENIARTETITAFNRSARQRYEDYGAEYLQIIALVDQRTTPWCRYRHLRIIKITDSVPAYHFQCLVGDTNVTPIDRAVLYMSRPYNGKVVTITTSKGYKLTVTPNHPIMTDRGFYPAHLLNKGDNVVTHLSGHNFIFSSKSNDQKMIPTIEKCFNSLLTSSKMFAVPMPTTTENFHGDITNDEVCIVLLDRDLLENKLPSITQQFIKSFFPSTNMILARGIESCQSIFSQRLDVYFSSFTNDIRFSCQDLLFLKRQIIDSSLLLFSSGSEFNSPLFKNSFDDFMVSKIMNTGITGVNVPNLQVSGDSLFFSSYYLRDFLDTFPLISEIDHIVDFSISHYSGYVYNIETKSNVYYANNVVTHNCRSTVAPVDPDWIDDDDLKWMQEEMKRAKDTGLNVSGKAPFDTKTPSFITPDALVTQSNPSL
jgi:SPP1 gp7 family putative phage head morphogenesis protein